MFAKILIANRGEIACRVIDTARRLGVATVAVYSDADRDARHVAMADEAVRIGGAGAGRQLPQGRRDHRGGAGDRRARRSIRAMAFSSENPDFVEAVEAAGLIFIGPSAAAIRAMGLKDAAKALMEEAGVPVVPGYHGADQDDGHLAGAAEAIGYPVLIKAVAGGGGKGMRRVDGPADFAEALAKRTRRGAHRLRQRRRADREIRREAAPYRGAGLRRRHATRCISSSATARCSAATRR